MNLRRIAVVACTAVALAVVPFPVHAVETKPGLQLKCDFVGREHAIVDGSYDGGGYEVSASGACTRGKARYSVTLTGGSQPCLQVIDRYGVVNPCYRDQYRMKLRIVDLATGAVDPRSQTWHHAAGEVYVVTSNATQRVGVATVKLTRLKQFTWRFEASLTVVAV
jgi:hypothetical protein